MWYIRYATQTREQVPGRGQREPPFEDHTRGAGGGKIARYDQPQGLRGLQLQAVRQQYRGQGGMWYWCCNGRPAIDSMSSYLLVCCCYLICSKSPLTR